ncbi:MAG TPA: acyltransferase family protein, partial [Telluria sp.]|nr:acyltransferase family protein [Telluria sp.]
SRILSLSVLAVLLTPLLDMVSRPAFLAFFSNAVPNDHWPVRIAASLAFVCEIWAVSIMTFSNVPYWSLSYEVWYYVLFGVLYFGRGAWRVLLAAAVLLVMGPKLWLLFPVWLAGVLLYKMRQPLPITTAQARAGWAITLAALVLYKIAGLDDLLRTVGGTLWPFPGFRLGSASRYLADYLVTLIMVPHFMFARQAQFGALQALQGPVQTLASYTFALYLVHGLVMGLWEQFVGIQAAGVGQVLALSACIGLATYACGRFGEHQRAWLRRRFSAPRTLAAQRLA